MSRGEETVAETDIRFSDGASYERAMGAWSRLAGDVFIDWLAPRPGLRWVDIGCGNGAFTELLIDRCAPAAVSGIDPSAAQIAYARQRPAGRFAEFSEGNAMALPYQDESFDAATMALVIFFVPDPAKGVAEMARVVRRSGLIASYAWDVTDGGAPMEPIEAVMRRFGAPAPRPPSEMASREDVLRDLWRGAGLEAIETRVIAVERRFADFEEYWASCLAGARVGPVVAKMPPAQVDAVKAALRELLTFDAAGRVTVVGRANAIKGRKPG